MLVNNASSWQALWKSSCWMSEPPPVDFSAASVLAAFWGRRLTTGYRIEITNATAFDGNATVLVVRTSPGKCVGAPGHSWPVSLATTEKLREAQFRFDDRDAC